MTNSLTIHPISGHRAERRRIANEMAAMPRFSDMTTEQRKHYNRLAVQLEQLKAWGA